MDIDFEPTFNDVVFIFDNTFKKYNENDNLKFWKFYDISNKRLLSFIFENNELFICFQQNIFGSCFLGNLVFTEPKFIIVKKIDPVIILIGIIYSTNIEKKAILIENIIHNYIELLNNLKDLKEKKDIIEQSKNFLNKIFELYKNKLSIICDEKENMNIDDNNFSYQFLESKVIYYLINKTKITNEDEKEIFQQFNFTDEEKEIIKKRKLTEKCEIIGSFLPKNIYNILLNNLNLNIKEKKEENEQKRQFEKNKKKNKEKKNAKNIELNKDQGTLDLFYKKKQ
jgi:hypothetical protein